MAKFGLPADARPQKAAEIDQPRHGVAVAYHGTEAAKNRWACCNLTPSTGNTAGK
jgi:hypothetical protein